MSNWTRGAIDLRLTTHWLLLSLGTLALLLGAPSHAQVPDPLASLDRTTIVEGIELTLRVRTRHTNHELDLAPLLRDFEVVSQAHSTNNPAITGLGSDFLEWEIVLVPRRTGNLTIPPLTVGNQQTRAIDVRVLTVSPEQRAVSERRIELAVEIDRTDLYVGEPTLVSLTLYYNVDVSGTFADINPGDSEWAPLGDGQTGTTQASDGREYNFTRFHYLYTPLSAGARELPAFEFEGDYQTHSLAPRQRLRDITSDPIDVTVKPIPAEFPDGFPWLPAYDVELTEQWSDDHPTVQTGEQRQRTLTLEAEGPAAVNLPTLQSHQPDAEAIRTYDDQARTSERSTTDQRYSTRIESASYLFMSPGDQTVPSVRVPWWDLEADALRWAELPTRTFTVSAPLAGTDLTDGSTPLPQDADADTGFSLLVLLRGLVLVMMAGAVFYLLRGPLRRFTRRVRARLNMLGQQQRTAKPNQASNQRAEKKDRTPRNAFGVARPWRKQESTPPPWLNAAQDAAAEHDWRALLTTLARELHADGWPDSQAVEARWGISGLTPLVKRTQQVVYGAPSDRIDHSQLHKDWQQLLAQWPLEQNRGKHSSGHKPRGLYPD